MRRIFFILSLFTCIYSHAQSKKALTKSDSLFAKGVELYNQGNYKAAIPLFAESDKIDKAELDSTSNRRDYSAMWLGSCYYKLGDEENAIKVSSDYKASPIDRRLTIKSDSLSSIGVLLYKQGQYKKALPYILNCAEIEKKELGNQHPYYANSLSNCSTLYTLLKDSIPALQFAIEAKEIKEKVYGQFSFQSLSATWDIATIYRDFKFDNNKEKAATFFLSAHQIADSLKMEYESNGCLREAASCYNHIGFASKAEGKRERSFYDTALTCLNKMIQKDEYAEKMHNTILANKAHSYTNEAAAQATQEHYATALSLEKEALKIRENINGKESSTYLTSLLHLSQYNYLLKNYNEAIKWGTEALNISTKINAANQQATLPILRDLVTCYYYLGERSNMLRLRQTMLDIIIDSFSKESPQYIEAILYSSNFYSDICYYEEELKLNEEAVSLISKIYGKECLLYANGLNSLALNKSNLGNYTDAIQLEEEALDICRKLSETKTTFYSSCLGNMALYYSKLGGYTESIKYGKIALKVEEQAAGKSLNYARLLSSMAVDYSKLKKHKESIQLGVEALNIQKEYKDDSPDYAISLCNLSVSYANIGNYSDAEKSGIECVNIFSKVYGKKHLYYIIGINNLAHLSYLQKKYSKAIKFGIEALNALSLKGYDKTVKIDLLKNLIKYYFESGDINSIIPLIEEVVKINKEVILATFLDLTSSERQTFWKLYNEWFNKKLPHYTYYIANTQLNSTMYNGLLLSKGLLLNADSEMSRLLLENKDSTIISRYNDIRNCRSILEKVYQNPTNRLFVNTDSLEYKMQVLEKELVAKSKELGDYTHNLRIQWQDVQKKLKQQDLAIEFLSFPAKKDSIMYTALLLKQGMTSPKMIPLFEKKQLDKIDKKQYYTTPALSQLIWKPLAEELKGVKNIYFAPIGELHNIAIEYLPSNDSTFIAEQINFYRLSSTRQLALTKNKIQFKKATLYGGLKYDTDTTTLIAENKKYANTHRGLGTQYIFYPDSLNLRDGAQYLPATKIETEEIKQTLENIRLQATVYMDIKGTEESFKALSGKHINMLHIATHGFYWTEAEAQQAKNLDFLVLEDKKQARYIEDKALTRSGLLLSGANIALQGKPLPKGIEDGILTAKELAELDLREIDLVVLSACQTGLGEITGDGVFGLQRGFKKAGANTLLMSLWKVDDDATRLLMTEFYKNLLAGKSKFESLRNAQKYVRDYEVEVEISPDKHWVSQARQKENQNREPATKEIKKIKKYKDPYYWAAFILLDAID